MTNGPFMRRRLNLGMHGLALLALVALSDCHHDEVLPGGPNLDLAYEVDLGDPSVDFAQPRDLAGICLQPRDCGVPGVHAQCEISFGNIQRCPASAPYCCLSPMNSGEKCVTGNIGCSGWRACDTNADCPPAEPYCCGDDDDPFHPHVDCRAKCLLPRCHWDWECPPDRPVCAFGCGECSSVCATR